MIRTPSRLLFSLVFLGFSGLLSAANPTQVNLQSDNNPALLGSAINFTATVVPGSGTGLPSGLVTFFDGNSALGTLPVLGGQAHLRIPNLAVGSHSITAQYLGYATFAGSTSAPLTEVLNLYASSVLLTSSNSNAAWHTSVTLSAAISVAGGQVLASGLVNFLFGNVVIARAPVLGGVATLNASSLPVGAYNIVAQYPGYGIVAGSSSAPLAQTITSVPTIALVTSSSANAVPRAPVTFIASVLPGAGQEQISGWVTFLDGTAVLGHGLLSNGSATLTTTGLAIGQHSITVQYPQQLSFAASVSSPLVENITAFPTNTVVTSSSNPAAFGTRVFFTATVSPGVGGSDATGTVQFLDGSTVLNSAPLVGGTATYHTSTLSAATHTITVTYLGDSKHSPNVSQPLSQIISAFPTTIALVSSNPVSYLANGVTFTATVSRLGAAGNPSGLVTFFDGATSLGWAPVLGGIANLPIYTLAPGVHTITAQYGAYGPDAGSISPPVLETVAQQLSASPGIANQGTQVMLSLAGIQTHFAQGATYFNGGTDIVATSSVGVADATDASVLVNISPTAILGSRVIDLITGNEIAAAAFTIGPGTPGIALVSPAVEFQGDSNVSVSIVGAFTHFVQGTSIAGFGSGVTVNSLTVNSPTSATANVNISPTAPLGLQSVSVTTGTEIAVLASGFNLLSGSPSVQTVTPGTAQQGQNLTVTIQGQRTSFLPNQTTVSFGSDINLGVVTVNGPANLTVPLFIPVTALTGLHTVTVTTGNQVVTGSFNVTSGVAAIGAISPNSGAPNTSALPVTITGNFTHFAGNTTTATFGPGIAVNGGVLGSAALVTVNSPTQATATLTIDPAAVVGPRDVTVQTNTETVTVLGGFTVQLANGTGPSVTQVSPANGANGIPINPQISLQFSQPLNVQTVTGSNLILTDTFTNQAISSTVILDATGRVATLIPNQNLAINRQYRVQATSGIQNNSGNALTNFSSFFTTGATPDLSGPTLLGTNPENGDVSVPLNFGNVPQGTGPAVVLAFDKPLNPFSLAAGVSLTSNGLNVPGTFSLSSSGAQVAFHPANLLAAGGTYVLSYGALTDLAGNSLVNPGSITFTAGTATDTTLPSVTSENPINGESGVGLNVIPTIRFSKAVNELTITTANLTLYDNNTSQYVPASVSVDPARLNATITPVNPLNPGDQYRIFLSGYFDIPGNSGGGFSTSFTTGLSTNATPLTVASVSPGNNTSGVAVNAPVTVVLSNPVNQLTTGQTAIQVTSGAGTVAGTITLASDQVTLTFAPTALLASSTTYTITVSGFSDVDGNAVAPFQSSFTTATSNVADTTRPSVSSITPSNASSVAVNTPVVVTFSEAVNPATVGVNSVAVELGNGGPRIAGTYAVSGGTVTFTPTSPYPANSTIYVYVDYYDSVQDLAANSGNFASASFGTANTPDTLPAQVVSVSPPNGSQNLGISTPVIVTFSKSINPSTINSHSIVLFNGNTSIGSGIQISPDNLTITLSQSLPHGATITLATTGIQDLSGNAVPDFTSQFTTAQQPSLSAPQVLLQRPGNGATSIPPNSVITLFTSASLNPVTVPGSLQVSQNGVLVSGTTNITGSGQAIEFIPSQPFSYGAIVQVFLTSSAQDINGNALSSYSGQFTIAGNPSTTPPTVTTTSPFYGAQNVAPNAVVDLGFNEALNPATVTNTSIYLYDASQGVTVSTSVSLLGSGIVVRMVPTALLTAGHTYYALVTSGVQNASGVSATYGQTGTLLTYFTVGTTPDTTAPTVVSLAPSNQSTNIGVNSVVRAIFSKPVDPTSVTSQTLGISYPGAADTIVNIDATQYGCSQCSSYQNVLPGTVVSNIYSPKLQLTLGPGTYIIRNATGEPGANPNFTGWNFNNSGANWVWSFVVADDSTSTVLMDDYVSPTEPTQAAVATLTGTTTFNGNTLLSATSTQGFTDTLTLTRTTTLDFFIDDYGLSDNLGGVALDIAAVSGNRVPSTISFDPTFTIVTATPEAPFPPSTQISVNINGIQDFESNTVVPVTTSFTTAAAGNFSRPQIVNLNFLNGQTNVPINTAFSLQFDRPMNTSTFNSGDLYLYRQRDGFQVPAQMSFSTDLTTVTLAPAAPLSVGDGYSLYSNSALDLAGNQQNSYGYSFTTSFQAASATPQVLATNPLNQDTGVATNVAIVVQFNEPIQPALPGEVTLSGLNNVVPSTATLSGNNQILTVVPASPLIPNTLYTLTITGITDVAGNQLAGNVTLSFTTGPGVDVTPAQVISSNPANGESGVGLNVLPAIRFSKPVDPLTLSNANFTLYNYTAGQYVAAGVSVSQDRMTAQLTPGTLLAPGTQYGFFLSSYADIAGNAGFSFSSIFHTGASADTTPLSVLSVSPTNQSSGVPVNAVIQLTMSKQVNGLSVGQNAISVTAQGGAAVTGVVSLAANLVTLTFTPTSLLSPSTVYNIQASGFTDVDGNPVVAFNSVFTTSAAATADTTPPSVLSVTPTNGALSVQTNSPIVVTFSEPINPATINSNTIAVDDGTLSGPRLAGTYSINGATVTFTPLSPYPANTKIFVAVDYYASLTDFAGNNGSFAQSLFTTAGPPNIAPPAVLAVSPSNGTQNVGINTPVVLTFSESLNPATVTSTSVTLFNGDTNLGISPQMSADNRSVMLSTSLPPGATITVAVTNAVQDLNGNALPNFLSQFTVSANPPNNSPAIIGQRPASGATGVPTGSVITLFANRPLNSLTIPSALHVSQNGVLINGSVSISGNGEAIEFTPLVGLSYGAFVEVFLDSSAQDIYGNALSAYGGQFTVLGSPASTTPSVIAYSPSYGEQNVPLNGRVDLGFNEALDPTTVTGSNIYLNDVTANVTVPSTPALSSSGQTVVITPTNPLTANHQYYVYVGSGVHDVNGVAANYSPSGSFILYFLAGSAPDSSPLLVTALAPADQSANIGINASIVATFNKQIDTLTVNGNTIHLSYGAGNTDLPSSIMFNSADNQVTIAPMAPLPASTPVTINIAGVTDLAGNAVAPIAATFNTAAAANFTNPNVIATNFSSGQSNVPVNTAVTFQFDRPMDLGTFNASNIYMYNYHTGQNVTTTISFSPDATMVTLTPVSSLAVDTQYGVFSNGALDLTGNTQNSFSAYFFTSSAVDTGAPQVVSTNPQNGATGVPINVHPVIQFSEPIQPSTLSQIILSKSGAGGIPAVAALSSGNQVVTLNPATPLQPGTAYTLTIGGVKDVAGNSLATVTSTFTTAGTVDVIAPSIIGSNPGQNETVGVNVLPTLQFNKPVDPLTLNASNVLLYNYYAGVRIPATVTVAANGLSITVQPVSPLQPGTRYYVQVNGGYTDIAGNSGSGTTVFFYTGLAADVSPLAVSTITPPNNTTGVPVNVLIRLVMNKQVDSLTVSNTSIQLKQGFLLVPGTVSLAPDGVTLTFAPSGLLNPSTAYTISLSGLMDVDGNALAPFSSGFTTGTSATADTTPPQVVSITPANGSTNAGVNTSVIVVFNKLINSLSVTNTSVRIADGTFFGTTLAGTYAVSGATVTFTPLSPYPANGTIFVDVDYFASVTDLAGNSGQYPGQNSFTTTNTPDTTAPTVLNVSPLDGSQNLGITTPIVLTFSKSVNPSTISNSTVTLFNGSTKLNPSISISADNSTVVLSTTLPAGATITVAATSGIQDLSGNPLVNFSSVFTTSSNPPNGPGSVIGQRPSNGATSVPQNSVITLFVNHPADPTTLDAALQVSQNGTLISGAINLTGGGQAIEFVPSVPFAYGANIQVFLLATAQDIFGNAFNAYSGQFNIVADPAVTAPSVVAMSPTYGQTGIPLNAVIDVGFNEALNPSTVNSSNALLYDATISQYITSTSSLPWPTVVRLTPSGNLTAGHQYYVYFTSGIQDVNGVAGIYSPSGTFVTYFTAGNATDTTPLTVTALAPPNAASGVGVNAAVRATFSKPIDPLSLNSTTFTVQYAAGQLDIPSSISFSNNNTQVSVTPMAPLPSSTPVTLTVNGVNDLAGNIVTPATDTFTTAPSIDTSSPVVVATSFTYGQVGIPVNAAFTLKFNKPMDTSTFSGSNLYLYDPTSQANVATTLSFSPDSTTVTLVPTSNLATNHTYYLYSNNAQDLAGNVQNSYFYLFTTGSATDTTPPAIVAINPANGLTGAPLNTAIQILFTKPVQAASFGQITLTSNGVPVAFTPVLSNANTLLTLVPQNTLKSNTSYTFAVSGVEDVAGNQQSGSVSTQFTTGTSVLLSNPTVLSASPTNGSQNIATNTSVAVTFSAAMDPATFDPNSTFYLAVNGPNTVVPATLSFSANYKTATLTPSTSLQSGTQYVITVTPALTDTSGNPINLNGLQGLTVLFTTQ